MVRTAGNHRAVCRVVGVSLSVAHGRLNDARYSVECALYCPEAASRERGDAVRGDLGHGWLSLEARRKYKNEAADEGGVDVVISKQP